MSEKNKSSQKKKSSEDPNSSLNNLPWTLPFAFPSLTPFGSTFPTFPFAPTNFGSLNSFASAFATPTPPPTAPLLSTDPNNPTFDYNEYAKQFGLLLNAFAEQGASSSAETANGKTSTSPTGLPFPYFLPSLLNQPATQSNATNPFAALANPTAGLYPFLTPDWFTAGTTLPNATNEPHSEPKSAKKRSKSIRTLAEEQEKHQVSQATTVKADFPTKIDQNNNGARLTNLNETNDDTKSNDDDESDPNPKRKKTDEVNETLVRIPLNLGWKRVTIVRAITRTGVRGDVFYYAPCGRKLRSFQEIDRYLSKKNITTLDRSHFTFSSKVHIGHFHEPREGPDGKIVFHESTEDEIVNRILEINPKFRRIEFSSSPLITAEHDESRSTEMKSKGRPTPNSPYQHTDFLKAIIEQQEQERKRQEMHYMKQLEMKKREEEKLLLLEQRKAEKNALRAKKIKETYTDIVLANESRRIIEDLQLKDLKPLPMLKPVENLRLSNEAFANCLVVLEFLSKFKTILQIPESLIPTLQTLIHPTSSRDFNALCQQLLRVALEDPGIPNPKKALTNLGQKLSDVDITEHTFSEILRIYIRERNGFDDRLSQTLSDTSFPALTIDDKMEILAFLCNDLTTNKRVVEEIDRNLEEFIGLKHEKFELERRLRRLKFERSNSMALNNGNGPMKKMFHLREKDLNSSENESPDESDTESIIQDQAAAMADDQDIEMLDETKIEDFEKRLTLVTRKYLLLKRRLIEKQCQIRALQLGEDRYHRRYWFFPQLHSIYVEGLSSGEIAAEDLLNTVENLTKQKSDRKPSICPIQRKKPLKTPKQNENDDETATNPVVGEDLATMDLSAFCMAVKREEEEATPTPSAPVDENAPLDLSCAKSTNEKVVKDEEISAPIYFQNLLHHPLIASSPTPIDWTTINYKQIEESIREKFQSSHAASIPEEFQRGWWKINQIDELRSLIKSLAKRGERERGLCRTLQRYFDVISHSFTASTKSTELGATSPSSMENHESEMGIDEQQQNSFNEMNDVDASHSDRTHEMDVLNEIYHLADRIIASSLQCRSYDVHGQTKRFTSSEIQTKHIDILDEAKTFLADLERNIERRYLKPPFVRKSEINLNSLNRINQHGTYHHTQENSSNEIVSASKYDEVPQQLERWRRTVQECRTPAQLALCLTQLERCIAWEKSIMRVFCEICNSDVDEEKLLLCDGCDHGTHTYCFIPPMSFIPPNDWYCYVCIGKAKGENLCFVCGNKGDHPLHKCEHCSKHFHEECLKQGKQQRGKWLCVLCAANDPSTQPNNSTHNGKSSGGRQTSRSTGRPPSTPSNHRKSKSRPSSTHQTDPTILHETHSNSSHAETTNLSSVQDGSPVHHHLDFEDDPPSPSITGSTSNGKKKTNRKSKTNQNENEEIKACRMILNELIKQDTSWPFQTPVDPKQHPDYYDCIKHPMDFSTMKKKMRNHQYQNREEFHQDVELILNNCRYYNEDDSPVGEAGHALRQFFDARWAKQFG